jgi:hypothetical protein
MNGKERGLLVTTRLPPTAVHCEMMTPLGSLGPADVSLGVVYSPVLRCSRRVDQFQCFHSQAPGPSWVEDDQITIGGTPRHHHHRVFPMAGIGARPDLNNHPRDPLEAMYFCVPRRIPLKPDTESFATKGTLGTASRGWLFRSGLAPMPAMALCPATPSSTISPLLSVMN